jgi:hypothetical protein
MPHGTTVELVLWWTLRRLKSADPILPVEVHVDYGDGEGRWRKTEDKQDCSQIRATAQREIDRREKEAR